MTPHNTFAFLFFISFTSCLFSSDFTPQQLAEQHRKSTVDDFKHAQQQIIAHNNFLVKNLQNQLACAYHSNNQLQYNNQEARRRIYQLEQNEIALEQKNAQLDQTQKLNLSHMQTFRKLLHEKEIEATAYKAELQAYKNEKLDREHEDQNRRQLKTTKNSYQILPAPTNALTTQKSASFTIPAGQQTPKIDKAARKAAKQERHNQEKQIANIVDCLIDELVAQQASDIAQTAIDDQRDYEIRELQAAQQLAAQEQAYIQNLEQQLIKDQQLVAQKLAALQQVTTQEQAAHQSHHDETLSAILANASAPQLSATDASKKSPNKKKNKKSRTTIQTVKEEKEDEEKNNQDLQNILENRKIQQELRSLQRPIQTSYNTALEQVCSNIAHTIQTREEQEQQKKERETQAILATLRAQAPQQPLNISDDHIKEDWSVAYNAMFQLYQYTNWEIYQQQRLKDIESEKAGSFDAQDDALEAWLEDRPEIKATYTALSDYQHALKLQDIPAIEQAITSLQQLDPLGIQRLLVMFDHIYHSIQKSTEQLEAAYNYNKNDKAKTFKKMYEDNKDSAVHKNLYLASLQEIKSQKNVLEKIKTIHEQQEIADVELMIHYDEIDLNNAGKLSDATLIRAETDMQNILAQNSPISFARATGIVGKLLQAANCTTSNIPLYQAIEQFCNASKNHIIIFHPQSADYAAAALYVHLQKRNGEDISLHDQIADQAKIYKHFILAHQKALLQIKASQTMQR